MQLTVLMMALTTDFVFSLVSANLVSAERELRQWLKTNCSFSEDVRPVERYDG